MPYLRATMALRVLILSCALLVLAQPLGASAVVPPKDCGMMRVDGKRYQVKVDQITCRSGRSYATKYLERKSRPSGYRCRTYPSHKGRVRFYCHSGRKIFFAIRR